MKLDKYKLFYIYYLAGNYFSGKKLNYIIEPADWVIKYEGIKILNNLKDLPARITTTHFGIRNKIIHFGSENILFNNIRKSRLTHKSNKIVVSWFHYYPGDERIKLIRTALQYVDIWHTSCNLTKISLLNLGIPEQKLIVIPLGVDLNIFTTSTRDEKSILRKKLKLPQDKIIIGSFQKDGIGWGKGMVPKFIKGPDIFCDAIEALSKKYDISVLLTGPSRGYIKNRLEKAKIQYSHSYLANPDDLAKFYKVIDLYLVTSRIEGGPKAILESLASGIPLVTTNVGMVSDIIKNGENGFVVEVGQVSEIVRKASMLIEDGDLRNRIILNGLERIRPYDWKIVAKEYKEKIYDKLLKNYEKDY